MLSERELLAAEFALGLLDGDERAQALRLRLADAEFAGLVGKWEHRAASFIDELPPEPLRGDLWSGILAKLAEDPASDTLARAALPFSQRAWRSIAMAASVAALVFVGLWALSPRQVVVTGPAQDQLAVSNRVIGPGVLSVAEIAQAGDEELVSAVYDRRSGTLLLRLASLKETQQIPVLWLIGGDGKPRSLGELQPGRAISLELKSDMREAFDRGATIAVSMEQPSNKPYGAPHGPILGKANLHSI